MSRFISCLRGGLARAAAGDRTASESLAVLSSLERPHILLQTNSSAGQLIFTQVTRSLASMATTIRRNLYTENALGVSKLDRLRTKKEQTFMGAGARERYIERLNGYIQSDDIQSIFKDDLVNLIGIANSDSELDLLESIVAKANPEQSDQFRGWGTLVMRLYYKMNKLDRALANMRDIERFKQFFNLRSCYKVLICMLYDAQRYDDVLSVFEFSQQNLKKDSLQEQGDDDGSSDRDLSLVALAAMARINNEQALQQAERLLANIRQTTRNVGLRPTAFVAYMAVSNNQPKLALNLISNVSNRTYITLRELKIISLIQLGRYEDILLQLREYVAGIKRDSNLLLQSTYDTITENKDKIQEPSMRQELEDILAEIKQGAHVSTATLEELLFKPIDSERLPLKPFDSRMARGAFRQPYNGGAGSAGGRGYQGYQGNQGYQNKNFDNNYDGGRSNRSYQSRGPRDYAGGNNQYNNRDRFSRRDMSGQEDEDFGGQGSHDSATNGRQQQQRRLNYQNMFLD